MDKFFSSLLILMLLSAGKVYGAKKGGSPSTSRLFKEEIILTTRITKLSQRFKDLKEKHQTIMAEPFESQQSYIQDLFDCYQDLKKELHWKLHLAGQTFTTWNDSTPQEEFFKTLLPMLEVDERNPSIRKNDQEDIFLYERKEPPSFLDKAEAIQNSMLELLRKASVTHKLLTNFATYKVMIENNSLTVSAKSNLERQKIQESLPKIYKDYKKWDKTFKKMDKVNLTENPFPKSSSSFLQKLKAFLKNKDSLPLEELPKEKLTYYLYGLHHLLSLERELQPQQVEKRIKFNWAPEFDLIDSQLRVKPQQRLRKNSNRNLITTFKDVVNSVERNEKKEIKLKTHKETILAKKEKEQENSVLTESNSVNNLSIKEIMKFLEAPRTQGPQKKNSPKPPASRKNKKIKSSLPKNEETSRQPESKSQKTIVIEKSTPPSKKTKNQKRKEKKARRRARFALTIQETTSETDKGMLEILPSEKEIPSPDISNGNTTTEMPLVSSHNDVNGENSSSTGEDHPASKFEGIIQGESIERVILSQAAEVKEEVQDTHFQAQSPLSTGQKILRPASEETPSNGQKKREMPFQQKTSLLPEMASLSQNLDNLEAGRKSAVVSNHRVGKIVSNSGSSHPYLSELTLAAQNELLCKQLFHSQQTIAQIEGEKNYLSVYARGLGWQLHCNQFMLHQQLGDQEQIVERQEYLKEKNKNLRTEEKNLEKKELELEKKYRELYEKNLQYHSQTAMGEDNNSLQEENERLKKNLEELKAKEIGRHTATSTHPSTQQ